MATTALSLIQKAQTILQDTTAIRWSQAELLGWLNDGQREIVMVRPEAYSKIGNVTTVAGTKQSIPTDGVKLIEVIRNMGAGGSTPGNALRKVPREILDAQVPGWHAAATNAVAQHYTFEPLAPKTFFLYPPSPGAVNVEVLYSATPPDVAAVGNNISLDDIYATPLIDYICFRAYNKDSEYTGNAERAGAHRNAFESALSGKAQADVVSTKAANVKG